MLLEGSSGLTSVLQREDFISVYFSVFGNKYNFPFLSFSKHVSCVFFFYYCCFFFLFSPDILCFLVLFLLRKGYSGFFHPEAYITKVAFCLAGLGFFYYYFFECQKNTFYVCSKHVNLGWIKSEYNSSCMRLMCCQLKWINILLHHLKGIWNREGTNQTVRLLQ